MSKIFKKLLVITVLANAYIIFPSEMASSSSRIGNAPAPSVVLALAKKQKLTMDNKIDMFVEDVKRDNILNRRIPEHKANNNVLRLMTYNVHNWMDPYFKGFRKHPDKQPLFKQMLQVVKRANPDVVVFQEVSLSGAKFIPARPDFRKTIEKALKSLGYDHIAYQPLKPSKGNDLFGNLIVSKVPFSEVRHKIYDVDEQDEKADEKRGFVNVKFSNISIYGTHLDVWDETEQRRIAEMSELIDNMNADKTQNVILLGDLNAVRKRDHDYTINGKNAWDLFVADDRKRLKDKEGKPFDTPTGTLDVLEQAGYIDSFTYTKTIAPKYTVWSGKVVDFIMLRKGWNLPILGTYPYYNAFSDHIPLIIDICKR